MRLSPSTAGPVRIELRDSVHPGGVHPASGFSTVELMISLTVLLIAVLGAVVSYAGSNTLLRDSSETFAAAKDAEIVLEDLFACSLSGITDTYPNDQPVPEFNGRSLTGEVVRVRYPNGVHTFPITIQVEVSWRDHQGRARRLVYHRVRGR